MTYQEFLSYMAQYEQDAYQSIYTGEQIDEGVGKSLAALPVDNTLSTTGKAADAKKTGDELNDLKSAVDQKAHVIIDTASGAIASFKDGADGMPLKQLTVNIEPVQAEGTPTPETPLPITGWNSVQNYHYGKNLINSDIVRSDNYYYKPDGTLKSHSAWYLSGFVPVCPNTAYTMQTGHASTTAAVRFLTMNKTGCSIPAQAYTGAITTFITPSDCYFVSASLFKGEEANVQLEIGRDASAVEPYQGNTYLITFPTEAGTVYGGTLTINDDGTGVLVVDRLITTLTGDESWTLSAATASNARRFTTRVKWPSWGGGRVDISSHFVIISGTQAASGVWGSLSTTTDRYLKLFDGNSHFANANELAAWLQEQVVNNTPVQVVYPINPEITYNLTINQITTLLGTNNVWADCGDVSAEYRADTKLYISKRLTAVVQMLGNIETGMTASKAYAVNDFLTVNNQLYIVTAPIASGGTITPGTNVTATTVGAQLTGLANS